jgi:membrane dipeptidase
VIVDAHNDLLLELVLRRDEEQPLELVLRRGEERLFERYWLPQLEAGGVGVQVCPLYAADSPHEEARSRALAQAAEFARAVEENAERVCQVRVRDELDDSRLRLVLSMEGVEPLEGDPGAFEEWYELGVRSASLTWNHANEFAGGIETPTQGLTDRGRTLVRRFAELGVVLDLAHASEQTWRDVLDEEVPFSVTHAGCRSVHDHPRNLADWQLEALAEHGGVLGVMALAFVVDPEAPTLSRWLDHVDHAVAVMGHEHVGLGADFVDQVANAEQELGVEVPQDEAVALAGGKARFGLEGFTGPDEYPALVAALERRGYDGERLDAILNGNWLRVLEESLRFNEAKPGPR